MNEVGERPPHFQRLAKEASVLLISVFHSHSRGRGFGAGYFVGSCVGRLWTQLGVLVRRFGPEPRQSLFSGSLYVVGPGQRSLRCAGRGGVFGYIHTNQARLSGRHSCRPRVGRAAHEQFCPDLATARRRGGSSRWGEKERWVGLWGSTKFTSAPLSQTCPHGSGEYLSKIPRAAGLPP